MLAGTGPSMEAIFPTPRDRDSRRSFGRAVPTSVASLCKATRIARPAAGSRARAALSALPRPAADETTCQSCGGYGGDADWSHGQWKGENFVERVTYDLTDPAVAGRSAFGVIDHVGHAVCREADGSEQEGWGMFEHASFGLHRPSGFNDWGDVAP